METQKIVNLISDTDNESSKFATKKYYVIHDQNCMNYSEENKNGTSIKFETKTVNSILCNYIHIQIRWICSCKRRYTSYSWYCKN